MAGAGGKWPYMPPPLIGVEPPGSPLLFCGKDIAKGKPFQVTRHQWEGTSVPSRARPGPTLDVILGLTG